MAKKLVGSYVGLAVVITSGVLLVANASSGCATGAADFGGAGGAGNTTGSMMATSSTKASGSTGTKMSTTGATMQTSGNTTGASMAVCGDGTCAASESCQTCSQDCTCNVVCGDGTCDASETCDTCPNDCFTGCGMSTGSSTASGTTGCDPCMVNGVDLMSCIMSPDFQTIFAICTFIDPDCCDLGWSQTCIDEFQTAGGMCP
ncbi:MAG: hypothetical protein U0414_13340 [Polyangiaceae bacterium]